MNTGQQAARASGRAMQAWVERVPWHLALDLTFANEPSHERAIELGRNWVNAEWGQRWPGYRPAVILFTEGGGHRRTHVHGLARF